MQFNDLDSLIDHLILTRSAHGNLPCFQGDMKSLEVDVMAGDEVAEPEIYPKGFVHFGEW